MTRRPSRLDRAALAAGLAAVLAACGGGGGVATADVGACLEIGDLEGEFSQIPTVECSKEHNAQVFHVFDLPDGDYPGDAAVLEAVEQECPAAFEEFVGTAWTDSDLQINHVSPSAESWADAEDREVLCIAYLEGSTTTESFEDSRL